MMNGKLIQRCLLATAFIGTIVLANALTAHLGLVPAGFGLMVLAGTYSAGLALGVRDALQEMAGVPFVVLAIVAGAAVSALFSPRLALASGVAFLVAELLDLSVYTPLRRHGFRRAVLASNAVGAVADTLLFLWLAPIVIPDFWTAVGGQLLVKAVWVSLSFLLIAEAVRRVVLRQPEHTRSA